MYALRLTQSLQAGCKALCKLSAEWLVSTCKAEVNSNISPTRYISIDSRRTKRPSSTHTKQPGTCCESPN